MSDRGRESGPPPEAGPAGPSPAPDDIFKSFVANAYAGTEATWAASVEELLDDDAVTEVGVRPLVRVAPVEPVATAPAPAEPPPADATITAQPAEPPERDTEVTRAAKVVRPPGKPAPTTRGRGGAELADDEPVPLVTRPDPDGTLRVVLLTQRKAPTQPPPAASVAEPVESPEWQSVVRLPSTTTQRREALLLVPEVAKIEAPPTPMREGSEDGMMPGGELDRKLGDMAVLLRYGHEQQVEHELESLRASYPRDLLMFRRIAEFWIATNRIERARELLFTLATGLFERRNVEGMRQALEQVLVLEPGNERALRLIALLDQRPTRER